MWVEVSCVLSQCTRFSDRWTDRRTERSSQYRSLHSLYFAVCTLPVYIVLLLSVVFYTVLCEEINIAFSRTVKIVLKWPCTVVES